MHEAAKRGNSNFLKECIENKVSPNSLDKSGASPLHWVEN
jgi:ankyrin repeat protein